MKWAEKRKVRAEKTERIKSNSEIIVFRLDSAFLAGKLHISVGGIPTDPRG